jgi:hypothetical protein
VFVQNLVNKLKQDEQLLLVSNKTQLGLEWITNKPIFLFDIKVKIDHEAIVRSNDNTSVPTRSLGLRPLSVFKWQSMEQHINCQSQN